MDFAKKINNYLESDRGKAKDFDDLVYNLRYWLGVKEKKTKTLSDKIIRVVTTSLEFPNDGRRTCEMVSSSELLCKRLQENKWHYALDFIDLLDIKEHLKEFIDWCRNDAGLARGFFTENILPKAKEIFGERLI